MNHQAAPWGTDRVMAMANSYWQACGLHAFVQTGLAAEIALGPAPASGLASRLGLDQRGTRLLLTALTTLGLLERREGGYAFTGETSALFTPGSARDMTNAVLHMADMVADWSRLGQCVREGRPVEKPEPEAGAAPSPGRAHFYRAMRDIARQQARGLAARLGL